MRRTLVVVTALAVVLTSAAAFAWYRSHQRYKHVAAHDPGMVYRCAWLEADVFPELIEQYQIRSVINLCEPGEMGDGRRESQRKAVTQAGAKLIELPLPKTLDAGHPAIARHVEVLSNPENYPILVHCQHGVTRTAMELAMYDVLVRHLSADDSLNAMPLFGRDDHPVPIRAFAKDFQTRYGKAPQTAARVTELRR